MNGLGGLIGVALFYFVMWLISNGANKRQEENAAEVQRKMLATKQQGTAGRAEPKKKYRQLEELRHQTAETLVPAATVSPPPQKRESMFGGHGDGAPGIFVDNLPGLATATTSTEQPMLDHANPIAQEVMAMMTSPQSMQQVVILSEIFNRPKSVLE